jgi:hypothetical protein
LIDLFLWCLKTDHLFPWWLEGNWLLTHPLLSY